MLIGINKQLYLNGTGKIRQVKIIQVGAGLQLPHIIDLKRRALKDQIAALLEDLRQRRWLTGHLPAEDQPRPFLLLMLHLGQLFLKALVHQLLFLFQADQLRHLAVTI